MMVMDLLEGKTLGKRLWEKQALDLAEVASILVPVVSAVGTAHALGIVHRDLKPENIFLAKDAKGATRVCVLDFGIAKFTAQNEHETGSMTRTGTMLGTPCYMSPEQGFGENDIDHRTDIWALGVILYEALSGARPVEGDNLGQVLKRMMSDGITPIQSIVVDLPNDVAELIGSMLSRERAGRPKDLGVVLAVLERYTDVRAPEFGSPISRQLVSEPEPSGAAAARVVVRAGGDETDRTAISGDLAAKPVIDTAGPTTLPARTFSKRSGVMVSAGAFVLLLAGFVSLKLLGTSSQPSAASAFTSDVPPQPTALTGVQERVVARPAPTTAPTAAESITKKTMEMNGPDVASESTAKQAALKRKRTAPAAPEANATASPSPSATPKSPPPKSVPTATGLVDEPPF